MKNHLVKIRRRTFISSLLDGAAAASVTNTFHAQTPDPVQCRLGPPPHDKGPRVCMELDQIEIDAAYDQSFYAPMDFQITKRIASANKA